MKTRALLIWFEAIAAISIWAPSPTFADSFEFLGSISSTHNISYTHLNQSGGYIALGDGSSNRNGVEIVNASDPYQMVSVAYDSARHMSYSFDWSGNYIYIPGAWDGLFIYDVTYLPDIIRASYLPRPGNFPIIGIAVRNGLAYIGAGLNGNGGALYCVLVIDPYHPTVIWESDSLECFEIYLGQNLIYTFCWHQDIKIFSILNPTSPTLITQIPCLGINAIDVDETRQLLYVAYSQGLKIYDVSNPFIPALMGETPMPNDAACIDVCHSKAHHEILFVSGYTGGLWAIDTSNPARPRPNTVYYPTDGQCNCVMTRGNLVFFTSAFSLTALRYNFGTGLNEFETPSSFALMQNYPNPFNNGTSISYVLPECTNIRLEIYDALGRKIETLYEGLQAEGNAAFQWDASEYSSGSYFYGLTVDGRTEYRKMTLIK